MPLRLGLDHQVCRQRPVGPNDPPPGDCRAVACHHTAHAAGPAPLQELGDVAVGHHPPRRDAVHDLEDCCGGDGEPTLERGRALLHERFGAGVLALVGAVTDDKSLPKAERKRLQVEHAGHIPAGAKLVKLADKIANLRDIAASPPADWPLYRRRDYFDWAAQVVDRLRGTHAGLEAVFDQAQATRPS